MAGNEKEIRKDFTLHTHTHEENSYHTTMSQKSTPPAAKPTPKEKKENK